MHYIIALVGMCGSGKSVVSEYLKQKGYQYLRFGEITMEEIKKKGLNVNEQNERMVREGLRKEHGMGAYALLNIPKIEKLLETGNVIVDGLYSWEEYKILQEKFGSLLTVIAVVTSKKLRYERLRIRSVRPLTEQEAHTRDYAEIENSDKGGPIAMADYTLINDGTMKELYEGIEHVLAEIGRE